MSPVCFYWVYSTPWVATAIKANKMKKKNLIFFI